MLRHPAIIHALASGACLTAARLLEYLSGRAGHILAFGPLPASPSAFIGAMLFGVFALLAAGWVLLRHRRVRLPLLSLLVLAAFWVLPDLFLPSDLFLLGFSQRIPSLITAGQLRAVAAKATALLGDDGSSLPGPEKWSLYEPARDAAPWHELAALPGMDRLDRSVVFTSRQGIVELTWGGALPGHWGVRIHAPTVTRSPDDHDFRPLEPDIAVFKSIY